MFACLSSHCPKIRCTAFNSLLSFMFACLSSHCPKIRCTAFNCLHLFYYHCSSSSFDEKVYLKNVMDFVFQQKKIDSLTNSIQKLSSVITYFLVYLTQLVAEKEYSHMYNLLSKFLNTKPEFDTQNVPEFLFTFFSSSEKFKVERSWMLNLLEKGLRDMDDFHLIEKRQVITTLMCFYQSPVSDNVSRKQILEVMARAVRISGACHEMCDKLAWLPWLRDVAHQQRDSTLIHDNYGDLARVSTQRRDVTTTLVYLITTMWRTMTLSTDTLVSQRVRTLVLDVCFDLIGCCEPSGGCDWLVSVADVVLSVLQANEGDFVNVCTWQVDLIESFVKRSNAGDSLQFKLVQAFRFWTPSKFDKQEKVLSIVQMAISSFLKHGTLNSSDYLLLLKWLKTLNSEVNIFENKEVVKGLFRIFNCLLLEKHTATKISCIKIYKDMFKSSTVLAQEGHEVSEKQLVQKVQEVLVTLI